MNTPDPAHPSDPTTPGKRPAPSALHQAATTAVAGGPAAIVTVWLLETWGHAHGQPLKFDSITAAAVGAEGAAIGGYMSQVFLGLWDVLMERLTRPG